MPRPASRRPPPALRDPESAFLYSQFSIHTSLLACALAFFSACAPKPEPQGLPATRPVIRQDVTLLDVSLALRTGSADTTRASDNARLAGPGDTVWVFPVARVLLGGKETLYLANTAHVGRVGRHSDLDSGWNLAGKLSIWNRLKNDLQLEWYEVRPVKQFFGPREPLRYRLVPLPEGRNPQPAEQWFRELTGPAGFLRLLVRVTYGNQSVASSNLSFETDVARIPWVSFRQDTAWPGRLTGLLGAIPYRLNSTIEQTGRYLCCDSRSLIASGLTQLGYEVKSTDNERWLDTLSGEVFSGYARLGRLYDRKGRRSRFHDIRPGDIVCFSTLGSYAVVLDSVRGRGYHYGGIPARLRLIRAARGSPEIATFSTALWSLRTLFGRSYFSVHRLRPLVRPTPPSPKTRPAVRKQPAAGKKNPSSARTRH